jgi:hypothetical protein
MSYRNPTQYIDRSLGKDVQQLQNTITSSFRSFGESYAKRQKEAAAIVKKETARRTKLTTDLEAKKLTLNKGFADLKENNNSYDFQKILGNELKVYNEYATSLINNTIDDPKEIARRKHRMAEIEGLPGSIKTDLGVIGSYSEGMGEKMNANGTFGGYYLGGKAQGLEYMQVLVNNLKGARNVNLQWDNEKGGYNISYVNTPEGGEPISINSRDLRAGEVGAKELVATIPDPTENQTAALKASGLYTKIRGEDGKEEEVLDKSYLQEEETIDDPNVKGGKLRVQRVDKNKFINNPQVVQAAKAYIDGLDPDDREALNNGIFAVQKENLLKKDSPEFYIPSYGDDEETNKANDALVLKNYIQYQADRIPSEKVLEEIKPEKPIEDKKPSAAQLKKAKDAEAIAGNFAQVIGDGKDLEDSLKKANITTNRVITDTGDENGKVLGYIAKKGDKEYRFMTGDSEREKVKKLLEFDGKLSASEIIENLDKLFPLGSKDPLNPNI